MSGELSLWQSGVDLVYCSAVIVVAVGEQEEYMGIMTYFRDNGLGGSSWVYDYYAVVCMNKKGIYLQFSGNDTGYCRLLSLG